MPRGPAPQWTRRLEPILDSHVQASIDAVNNIFDPETGHYGTLIYKGCADRERAKEIVRALHRSAKHLKVSMSASIKKRGDEFDVHFSAINKAHARAYVVAKYGTDRSKWPYNPRQKGRD